MGIEYGARGILTVRKQQTQMTAKIVWAGHSSASRNQVRTVASLIDSALALGRSA